MRKASPQLTVLPSSSTPSAPPVHSTAPTFSALVLNDTMVRTGPQPPRISEEPIAGPSVLEPAIASTAPDHGPEPAQGRELSIETTPATATPSSSNAEALQTMAPLSTSFEEHQHALQRRIDDAKAKRALIEQLERQAEEEERLLAVASSRAAGLEGPMEEPILTGATSNPVMRICVTVSNAASGTSGIISTVSIHPNIADSHYHSLSFSFRTPPSFSTHGDQDRARSSSHIPESPRSSSQAADLDQDAILRLARPAENN